MDTSQSISGRPTWAEIDLGALAHNYGVIRNHVGVGVKILAAVKANAYGHGAVECARRLESAGVDWFGVALPEEGLELRQGGITKPILCLGGFWPGQESALLREKLTPVVYRVDMLESLNRAAQAANLTAAVHVKVDSGMGRLGVRADKVVAFCGELKRFSHIRVDGLMTHLAVADDETREDFTSAQLRKFETALTAFREHGFSPTVTHVANSAATFARGRNGENMVRPGGTLYGFIDDVLPANIDKPPLRPVMSLYSRLMLLKTVPAGEKLGYGTTFETRRASLIATLPVGYNDGYLRALSNRGRVIIRGQYAPVVGRVSMDMTLVDVTEVAGARLDDQVILLGSDGSLNITAEEIGATAGTISYEITCGISDRVPRIYQH